MKTLIIIMTIQITMIGNGQWLTNSPSESNELTYHSLTSDKESDDCMDKLSYEGNIKSIIESSCALSGCHVTNSSMKGDFTSYAGIKEYIDSSPNFKTRILVRKDMPPVYSPGPKKLDDAHLQAISCWIDQGYPE